MNRINAAQRRLQQASDRAAVLDAAYQAFVGMLSVIHSAQDPASGWFAAVRDGRRVRRERPQRPRPRAVASPAPAARHARRTGPRSR